MGGTRPWPQAPVGNADHTRAAVAIIGAGMSGMCMAIELLKAGVRNFVILEKSSSFGGTWHDNRYPGCCCDILSLLYSYSFEQKPDWSREYPGQEEILAYLRGVAGKYGLYEYVRFNSAVESCTWDDEARQWNTRVALPEGTKDGEFHLGYTLRSDFVVSAVGQLNVPRWPDLAGLHDFKGRLMHSARWDWSYDLHGKRIAVIGSGATATQLVPELAKVAAHLTVYQRTPSWILPRMDAPVSRLRQTLQRYFPPLMWRLRALIMDFREWSYGAIVHSNHDATDFLKNLCVDNLHTALPDRPDLWAKLTPSYPIGCKRLLASDDFYPCLLNPNVSLETRRIRRVVAAGIEVDDGDQENGSSSLADHDLIVLATGFRSVDFMHPIKITGTGGLPLSSLWTNGAYAYLGMTIPSMPNFAMLYGVNANLGHSSIVLMIEAQCKYIAALVQAVRDAAKVAGDAKRPALAPKQHVVDEFNEGLQKKLRETSFADPSCNSWYKDPTTGRITTNWGGTVVEYQRAVENVRWDEYDDGALVVAARSGRRETKLQRVREETVVSNATLATVASAALVSAGVAASWLLRRQRV